VIFLDALVCKVRQDGTVKNQAAHLAVGVDADGKKACSASIPATPSGRRLRASTVPLSSTISMS
jgi:hypothetical protein